MNKKRNNKQNKIIKQEENGGVLLKGKFQCECHAMLHKLVNNCVNCGRIVCEQEGEGDCQTCGNKIIARAQGKGIQQIQESRLEEEFPAFDQDMDLEKQKAIQLKNTLIKRDKSDFIKNNVYDEQVDWYQIQDNVWQSKENREKAVERLIERNNKLEEYKNSNDVYFDPHKQQWIKDEKQFDEQSFLKEAREFSNVHTGNEKKEHVEVGVSNLSAQEKKIYESVREELQSQLKEKQANQPPQQQQQQQQQGKKSKQNKKQEESKEQTQPQKKKRIVQNDDDFYSQFI